MERRNFAAYCTGEPLVTVEYSYTDATMTRRRGRTRTTIPITAEQRAVLQGLRADQQVDAAHVFVKAAHAAGFADDDDGAHRNHSSQRARGVVGLTATDFGS